MKLLILATALFGFDAMAVQYTCNFAPNGAKVTVNANSNFETILKEDGFEAKLYLTENGVPQAILSYGQISASSMAAPLNTLSLSLNTGFFSKLLLCFGQN